MRKTFRQWLRLMDAQIEGHADAIKYIRREIRVRELIIKSLKSERDAAIKAEQK